MNVTLQKLFDAIDDGDAVTVRNLIKSEPSLIHVRHSECGDSPLSYAVRSTERQIEVVRTLLEEGADVRCSDEEGYTALHCAVDVDGPSCRGEMPYEIIRLLVEAGGDLEAVQHYGWTPLARAVIEGTVDETRALLRLGSNPNLTLPLHTLPAFMAGRTLLMASLGTVEKVAALLEFGVSIHAKDAHGDTFHEYATQLLREPDMTEDFSKAIHDCISLVNAHR